MAVLEFVAVDGQETPHINCTRVDSLRSVIDVEESSPSPALDALKARLRNAGFDDVVQSLDDAIESAIDQFLDLNPGATRPDAGTILNAVVAALSMSVQRIEKSELPDTRDEGGNDE